MDNKQHGRFFIVGAPRSGTTLLQAMLNRHPGIAVPAETKVYCDYDGCSRRQQLRCLDRLRSDFGFVFDQNLAEESRDLLVLLQTHFLESVQRTDVQWVGEKTPEHTSRLQRIRDDFPDSPIIAVIRNGFDVSASLTRVPWIRCGYGSGAVIWNYYMNHICRFSEANADRFLAVSYEELCSEPLKVLDQVFLLLGVDKSYGVACLSPDSKKDQNLFPARELEWKSRSLQPLQTPSGSSQNPSERVARQIQVASEPMLHRWGYLEKPHQIPFSERLFWKATNAMECIKTVASLPRGRLRNELEAICLRNMRRRRGNRIDVENRSDSLTNRIAKHQDRAVVS